MNMTNELKSISAIAVVIEGTSTNGVQSMFKLQISPQTQDRDQLERASKALPTLLELLGLKMAAQPEPKIEELDSLDDVPQKRKKVAKVME